ncbi:DUF2807 domain-containing protein [Dysgonomonas sp. 216]|uniref:head GIN domain-containing protein n=1 Tax=Dysgonomonas sp. 216 TaxID=2302934 RepID=UPI0013D8B0AC|nr:head GIN domain-containing protein [Dysgonomonas sp. 216]NDW19088.1 DUF2807 domain-containing protein [Dysgonomonas sp. 216]
MKNLFCLSFFLLLMVTSCSTSSCATKGNKKIVTKEANLGNYTKIDAAGPVEINYEQTSNPYFRLEVDENVLSQISYSVEGNTLVIHNEGNINPSRYVVYTGARDLSHIRLLGSGSVTVEKKLKIESLDISLNGSGDVKINNIDCRSVKTSLNGSGDVDLSGNTLDFQADLNGSGDISAYALKARNAICRVKGSGDIEVYAEENLNAEVRGSGDISYKGNPSVAKTIKGSGDISKK